MRHCDDHHVAVDHGATRQPSVKMQHPESLAALLKRSVTKLKYLLKRSVGIGAVAKRSGLDRDETAQDLAPPNSGEKMGFLKVQAAIYKRCRDGVVIFS